MTPAPTGRRIGVLVNPIAGIGGRAGLGGSDGEDVQRTAATRGGVSFGADRMAETVRLLRASATAELEFIAAPGAMGAQVLGRSGFDGAGPVSRPLGSTTAADTVRYARELAAAGVDLILFAGGDGTAAAVARGLTGTEVPALGVPSGVKMYSGCFAITPAAAAKTAADFVAGERCARRSIVTEIVDLDEELLRRGVVAPRLVGALRVPVGRLVQHAKVPSTGDLAVQTATAAAGAAWLLDTGDPVAVGPGGTTAALLANRGLEGSPLGVDLVGAGTVRKGLSEPELFSAAQRNRLRLVLTVVGGQGFVLGRGNQQLSPRVLRCIRPADLHIVAPAAKLAALGGRSLLVDTGDPSLDTALSGYHRIITGPSDSTMYPIAATNPATEPERQYR